MTLRTLQKWHGVGNDFLVDVHDASSPDYWTPERVRAVCHRSTGVGADGLLVATLAVPVAMTLYNADGSLAETSGNGLRCLAAAVRRATGATWDSLEVSTAAGARTVRLTMDGLAGYGSVAMGEVSFSDPLEGTFALANVGNPHVIVFDDAAWSDVEREDRAAKLAAQLGGANVEFVTLLAPGRASIRVLERGVGWTLACGSGSVAVAAALRRAGLCGDALTVENPGGTLHVGFDGEQATLSGPVQFVADVEWLEA